MDYQDYGGQLDRELQDRLNLNDVRGRAQPPISRASWPIGCPPALRPI